MLEKKWWQEKVAYQIYPKSFLDTNGDGIGDLRGIINKLDYLKDLGVDIIWLSPCYCTPFVDQGYDISDYQDIDPSFGTMDDMDELLAETKKRDMYIIMDLVANHCSDEHKWFKEACKDPDGKYGKYFYIETSADGKLPNNWRSHFGGTVWEKLPGHEDKYYLHSYTKGQPDLNWENPEVRQELFDMINWWFEKGVAGFRLDAIINIKKTDIHHNYPADMADGLVNLHTMLKDAVGVDDFLQLLKRETFDKYDAFTVGEVWTKRPDALQAFIGNGGHFSSMFDFTQMTHGHGGNDGWYKSQEHLFGEEYKQVVFEQQKKVFPIGYISNIIENHDQVRGVNHFMPEGPVSIEAKKMIGAVNFMLRGLPFIYQGQEIGMENTAFHSIEEIDDCNTQSNYKICLAKGFTPEEALRKVSHFCRDNARTPFQWDDSANAGFTTGTPWMKTNPNYESINAASQIGDPNSVLSWYKQLIALRKNPKYQEAIVYGELIPYKEEQYNLMAYYRQGEENAVLVLANYQPEPQKVELPEGYDKVLMNNYPDFALEGNTLSMKGYQFIILAK